MQGNKRRDTRPELGIRRLLHRAGLRYLVDQQPTPSVKGRADIVFRRARIAIFIDGCFWHGCPEHYRRPSSNKAYWNDKLQRNRQRDADVDHALRQAGWRVLRYWEHDEPEAVVESIKRALREAKPTEQTKAHGSAHAAL